MKKYATEFIGTFFLVLTIWMTVTNGTILAPLAIGLALMVMVYMGGWISGGHFNPAVSLAAAIRGALPMAQLGPYMIAQVLGAFAASAVGAYLTGKPFVPAPGTTINAGAPLVNEIVWTFALALMVLNVATVKKTSGNSYYGLAIGMTVTVGAFAGGGVSGGAYNPAVGLGPILYDLMHGGKAISHAWLYIAGPFTGAALAALVFRMQHAGEEN